MLVLLLPLGVLAAIFAVGMFTLGAWLKALIYACEAKFMPAGWWLCVGLFMVNAIKWHDFMPLYSAVLIASVVVTVLKHVWQIRRQDA